MKKIVSILVIGLLLTLAAGCQATTLPAPAQSPAPPQSAAPADTPPQTPAPTPTPAESAAVSGDLMTDESVGPLRIGMFESELVSQLGQPDTQSPWEMWEADGLEHADWTFEAAGLTIGMERSSGQTQIHSILAAAPCSYATGRGIAIGDTKEDVLAAYGNEIDPEFNDDMDSAILIGTPYGGLSLTLQNGAVTSIFLGASAE